MRFLFALCLGFFCSFMSAQDSTQNQMPTRATSANPLSAAESTSKSTEAQPRVQQVPQPTNLVDAPSATQQSSCTQKTGNRAPIGFTS